MRRAIGKHLGDFVALLVLFLIAIGVSGYIIANQDARPRIPFIEAKAFTLKAAFSDAQAVTPGQGQSVRVAGVQVGKITQVKLQDGTAIVTMELDPKWEKKLQIKSDATALLRPRTGLKDMFVELDPGGNGTPLKNNDTIPVQNTAPDVDPDETLSALDTDTRRYLELLINSAGKGLKGHGNDLNLTFKALAPTYQDLARVSSAIAISSACVTSPKPIRTNCPAACASASRLRARSRPSRCCCSWTNRWRRSMRKRASSCRRNCIASGPRPIPRSSTSRTTSRRRSAFAIVCW